MTGFIKFMGVWEVDEEIETKFKGVKCKMVLFFETKRQINDNRMSRIDKTSIVRWGRNIYCIQVKESMSRKDKFIFELIFCELHANPRGGEDSAEVDLQERKRYLI